MEKDLSKAFAEVLYMLDNIEVKYKSKVPRQLIQIFKEECDENYLKKIFEEKNDFLERDYSDDALAIIAYINLKYMCETNEEKKYYRDMYLKK